MEQDAKDLRIAALEADLRQQIEVNLKLHEMNECNRALAVARMREIDEKAAYIAGLKARIADLAGRVAS